ncbi:MAG: CHRD domain-containing protein [Gemmatimonadales bacterium]
MRSAVRVLGPALVVVAAVVACQDRIGPATQGTFNVTERFSAALTPAKENPPITDTATTSDTSLGTASAIVVDDTILILNVDIERVDTPTLAHIHTGNATTNGGVIVDIMVGTAATRNVARFTGPYGDIQVVRSALRLRAVNFDSLLKLVRAGNAYVNVHSKRHPGGIIRAQLTP